MKNFYVFYGRDKSKADKNSLDFGLIKNEVDKLIKKINTTDIIYYDLETNSLRDIIDDAATISMFSDKKVIVIENAFFLNANKSIDDLELLPTTLKEAFNFASNSPFILKYLPKNLIKAYE